VRIRFALALAVYVGSARVLKLVLVDASPVVGAKTRACARARALARAPKPARWLTELLRNITFSTIPTFGSPITLSMANHERARLREFHPLELILARAAPYHGDQPGHKVGQ
jgi:hypothetical protein